MEDLEWIARLHDVVDELTAPIAAAHPLSCREGCSGCCTDGLTVFAIEAERIRARHADLLANGEPSETGCAFLDARGSCRIYEVRPYVCRTQGLPLRWLEVPLTDEGGEAFEARDVCPLNLEGVDLAALPAEAMWTIGPIEQRLASKGAERAPLRNLFAKSKHRLPVIE